MSTVIPPPPARPQMSRTERIIFAAGDVFGGGNAALISVLYLFYLTDVIGLPPAWAGFAVLIPRIWDAINDPLMGLLSDNARTRWGRRRPFIFAGALLLTIALGTSWAPIGGWDSQGWKVTFVVVANLFYTTVATMIAVPYGSLSTEVTTDYEERNLINILRMAFSTFSGAACTVAGTGIISAYTRGELTSFELYLTIVLGFGTFFGLPLLLVSLRTRERAPIPHERVSLSLGSALAPLRIGSFRKLLGMYLCQAVTMDVISALVVYYAVYVVPMNMTVFLGIFIGVNAVGFLVASRVVRYVSKNLIYRFPIPIALVGAVGIGVYPADAPTWAVYVFAAMVAVGIAGGILMTWVMFPDVVDDAELTTGARNAGSFSGLMILTRGLATAGAVQLIGLMLQFTGYRPPEEYANAVQPEATLLGIRITMAGSIVVFLALGWWLARRYPLTRTVCAEMQVRLAEQRERLAAEAGDADGDRVPAP